ncbi:potassium channel family protein [Ktedonobacter racemifer]|uniref:Trk system potassium uptake protein TrkA n=1 Tax=Ktedonobacter racemifer DSM 44963 TaxID=485913 RepID=D6TMK6_KTERA|nr:TrkA family potassium uptake protein [Ktedonobacter racemifer]EFH87006.1 TrkA-N domain protein [Ktedonobacter racemifer DSM 44963]
MYIIVGGGGDVGYYLTRNLLSRGHEVLLLEKSSNRVQTLGEELGQSVIKGDACEARIMEEAGAQRADVVIAVTGEDEDNLVICQMAKKRFNVTRTIARLNNPKHEELFQKLGIDVTISPTKAILSLIESELPGPHFIPLMTLKKAGLEIVALNVPPLSPVSGKKLSQVHLPRKSTLAMIMRGNEPLFPTADTELQENDEVYALLSSEGEEELRKVFGNS